jgi:hypothetical protein
LKLMSGSYLPPPPRADGLITTRCVICIVMARCGVCKGN